MGKNKLILINPTLYNPFPGFPPLALGYIAALTPDHWDIEIIDENFDVATFKECDLVGITGFTSIANRAYEVAQIFREKNIPVVMGGIHASMVPDEALQFVDTVVIGEAESVWADVIADADAGRLKQKYFGTPTDLKGLVIPRRDLFHKNYIGDTLQTTRGCPNDCEFCSVSQFNGFAYRQRPVEEVLDEMATLKKKYLFIVDDNIVGVGPERENWAIAFARGMIERKLKFAWYSHAALNVADNEEVLKAFGESGCRLLFLGMESEDHEILKSMNKKINLTRDYERVIRKIHENHIGIHGSFIFGTDEDTIETLQRRFDFILDNHIDVLQYCTLTPYPGTRLFDRLRNEGRLFYTNFPEDWSRYDLTEILFKPQNLDVDEYREIMRKVGNKIFSRRNIAKRFFRSLRDTRSLQTSAWCLFTNSVYTASQQTNGQPGEKFWHFSYKSWPVISFYERIEKYF
ncbi:MAG: B12-binding domain-containing radical SAM protein [Chloroflexi bacterium]|nr:B12-binding domain-containing radical SAM protein [Chloroflexota bacterium]